MKKFLLLILSLTLMQNAYAKNITNPLFIPKKDTFLSTSFGEYRKFHLKEATQARHYLRSRKLGNEFEYGLSDTASLLLSISNTWTRQSMDFFPTHKENTNINWSVGGHYDFYHTENYFLQAKVRYLQQETHHYNGAYKALDANIRTGYDLGFVLPYVGLSGQLPIAQSKLADDKVKASAYGGLYTDFSFVALDISVNYDYDRFDWNHKLYMHSSLDFLIGEHFSIGGYFDRTLIDKNKYSQKADEITFGGQIKMYF